MFEELPETNPPKNKKRPKAFLAAALFQVAVVSLLIIVQMAMPSKLGRFEVLETLYMAPLPPPPPPPPPAPAPEAAPAEVRETPTKRSTERAAVVPEVPKPEPIVKPVEEPELVAPTAVPKDIARIMEVAPSTGGGGVIGGVPGGIPGGVSGGTPGGVLGGVLGGISNAPPPPPPKEPIRVGGNIRQPKAVKVVEPKYPPAAKSARIEGSVIIEATLTAEGTIEKLKVISGPPLLVPAAVEAVQQWKYEPTYLNGQAVPVIITAKVNFALANAGR
jgi:protein TonB